MLEGRAEELRRINATETIEYSRTNYPSPQTCGILCISYGRGPATRFSQTLDLYEGVDRVCWQTEAGTHRQAAFVRPDGNVTEILIDCDDGAPGAVELRLARAPSEYYAAEEALDGPDGFLGFTFTFPDGLQYANVLNAAFDHRQTGRGVHKGDVQEFSVGSEYEFAERVFQIETNSCPAEAVNLMLLQSFGGEIAVFPAYPWKSGAFESLRAEGGFAVSASMRDGRLESLCIESLLGRRCTVYLDAGVADVAIEALDTGESVTVSGPEPNPLGNKVRFSFDTRRTEYRVTPLYS